MTNTPQESGYDYQPPPPYPAPAGGGRKTGVIITGVIALVAGVGIGVAGFAAATDDDPDPRAGRTSTGARDYSMSSVRNACDLIDPTMLTRWSTTPEGPPEHRETRPTRLFCEAGYSTRSTIDTFEFNEAEIRLEAELTEGTADPGYDRWKRRDTAPTGSDQEANGKLTGIGSQGYWHWDTGVSLMHEHFYIVAVQDGNVSVRVKISLTRADGEPPVTPEEIDSVARAEVTMALNGLEKK
jgi:hypothetical protein